MKKGFTIILGILLITTLQLNAAFLRNIKKTITQPDGTTINCFASGDEFHNWLHDKNDYTIIQSQKDGYYYYAKKKGTKIVPSKYKVGTTLMKSTDIQPGVNISAEQWRQKRERKRVENPIKPERLKTASTAEIKINQICIYIRFSDDDEWTDPNTSTAQDTSKYFDWLNDEDPSAVSMINYYKEVSYGKVEMRSHFYPRSSTNKVLSYQDTQARGHFQEYNETTNPDGYDPDEEDNTKESSSDKREWDLLERAIDYFNANYTFPEDINLDIVNTNGELVSDGLIDNIEFFIAGDAGDWSDLLWPHKWSLYNRNAMINGLRVYSYNFQIQSITDQRGVGVLSHEMGHTLGYPDLYQYEEGSTYDPVGPWDIMATTGTVPQSFGAFTKFKYGNWIESIPEITEEGTYSLKSIDSTNNNCYKIASPYTTDEYFVLEYRKKAGRFEGSLPGSGLLVYRINTKAGNGNADGIVNEVPDEIYIYRPGGTTSLNGQIYQANFSARVNRTAIDNTTNPTPFLFSGSMGGLYISEISVPSETISFKVEFKPDALYADFNVSENDLYAWETTGFTDISAGAPDTWEWTFEGGNPSAYNEKTPPPIQYSAPGTYDVSLTVGKGGESATETRTDFITVIEMPGANTPRDLTTTIIEANPSDVVLNWTEPESGAQSFTIQWDDGENDNAIGDDTQPDSFDALSHWDPRDLLPYDEMYITEISFFPSSSTPATVNDYTLKIYTGSDLSTLAVDQVIPPDKITFNNWNTIELTTPLQIDASINLWFGFNNNSGTEISGFPFGVDKGPANEGKGDVIYYVESGTAYFMNAEWGLNYNFNIAATVVNSLEGSLKQSNRSQKAQMSHYKSMNGYNIYRDDVKINTTVVSETSYADVNVPDGNYNYYTTAVYSNGESLNSNISNITVIHNVGIPQVEIKEISIYPNPVKEKLYIQLEEISNDPLTIQIYDQMGKLVYTNEINPNSDRFDISVNNLVSGAYTLLMFNTEKGFQSKFIVMK